VTDLVYPYSFIPLVRDPDGRMLTGYAARGNGRLPGAPVIGEMALLAALPGQDGPDPDVRRRAGDTAEPVRTVRSGPPDVAEGQRRACVSWRCDGR